MTPDFYIPVLAIIIVSLYVGFAFIAPPVERWREKRHDIKAARKEAETYGRRFGPQ